jgi:hypothetical protein
MDVWYLNGLRTQVKNGKEVDQNGNQWWWKDSRLHRDDGPAIIYCDGTKYWYKNGCRHRENGPAVIRPNAEDLFFIHDISLTKEEWWERISEEAKFNFLFKIE